MAFAQRLNRIQPSMILGLVQKTREMQSAGRDVIDLGIGEPDFDTPENIKQATIRAMNVGETICGYYWIDPE